MPLDNLAKVFAPTLVDHSSPDLDPNQMYGETMIQVSIMTNLLNIPGIYWSQFTANNIVGYSTTSSTSEPERDVPVDPSSGSSGNGAVGQNPKYYIGKMRKCLQWKSKFIVFVSQINRHTVITFGKKGTQVLRNSAISEE